MQDRSPKGASWLDTLVEAVFWLRIFISPFLIGVIAGLVCWFTLAGTGKVLAVMFALAGLVGGYLLAESARRGGGTVFFMSRLNRTPNIYRSRLIKELNSKDPAVIRAALVNLDELGRLPIEAGPTLKRLRQHDDPEIAERAAAALVQLQT